jgi:hypothetical protein
MSDPVPDKIKEVKPTAFLQGSILRPLITRF